MAQNILEVKNITKSFGRVKALKNVSFNVEYGEVHALVGENGAGKSTLMKILSGVYPVGEFDGDIFFDGTSRTFKGIKESEAAGIYIVYQELNMVKSMNVFENIFMGNEIVSKSGIIDIDQQVVRAKALLEKVCLDISPWTKMEKLGTGKQQLIEISKAIDRKAKLLILDEPTASLPKEDTQNLFKLIHEFKEQGITCIYISHKMDEIFAIADRVTVLRDGETIVTKDVKDVSEKELISYMAGRELTQRFPHIDRTGGETVCHLKNWCVRDAINPGKYLVDHVEMEIRKGEILGISGLMGSGRTELAMSIFGALETERGSSMTIDGQSMKPPTSTEAAVALGIGYVSEDRKRYGLVLKDSIRANMSLASLKKLCQKLLISEAKEKVQTRTYIEKLQIKTPTAEQKVGNLSGGNQQKVILAKWLLTKPRILILDEPTRGIDVGAKVEIYGIMNQLVDEGVSIVMISSELPEIIGMSDRVYIMREGKIAGELTRNELTQEDILTYAVGGSRDE